VKKIKNNFKFLIYPILVVISKILANFVPTLHSFKLNSVWTVLLLLLPKKDNFIKSVYGPYLHQGQPDHQLYLCATGKSGHKLSSIISSINRKMVFLDIGSNIGVYSLLAESNSNFLKITAVEPNPIVLKYLKLNINANYSSRIEIVSGAVSKAKNKVELRYNDWHMGMGSISRPGSKAINVNSLNQSFFDNYTKSITENVF